MNTKPMLLLLLVSIDADAEPLQDAHVLFGTDLSFFASQSTLGSSPAEESFGLRLGADALVTRHLTLGGTLGVSGDVGEDRSWDIGLNVAARAESVLGGYL